MKWLAQISVKDDLTVRRVLLVYEFFVLRSFLVTQYIGGRMNECLCP